MYQAGYWVDLKHVRLDEASGPRTSWIQAMPLGEYMHPVYGEIKVTPETIKEMESNVASNVRGIDLDIDYDHKEHGGEAAGWIRQAQARSDGLWVMVEWTQKAWDLIKEGAYRYFSPEYNDEWTHPKTKQTFKNVLFGGGITNRPFLKDILPINMSELFAEQKKGTGMDPKELRKLLGLAEDATDEQVKTALEERKPKEEVESAEDKAVREKAEADAKAEKEKETVAASELDAEVIKLAEKSPAIKALVESVTALQKTVQTQGVALQLSEVHNTVTKLSEPQGNRQLPPSAQEALKEILLQSPSKELNEKLTKFVEGLNKTGYVQLGEAGGAGEHGEHDGIEATKKFNDAVEKVVKEDKLSYGDAVERVASLQPDLFEAHRQASYAFKEN